MADETTDVSSDDAERREDLIACRDCGVVFAHLRGLEAHSQQGCGKKNGIVLPMTGKDVEDALSGLPVTVCCAEDLPSYVSDRPRTFVVNTDNCDQKGSHWVAFLFPHRVHDTDPIYVRGGKTNDITERLLALPKDTELKNIIIQVGSNDCCSSNFESDTFNEDYKILVATAKSVCENVVISGMCPRLDDSQGNIVKGNERIKQIANDKNFLFIDNDFNFRLLSGAIDMSLYNRDGVHLNTKGVAKLVRNLDITPKEKPKIHDDLRRTPAYQKPRRQDNTNSGYAHSHRTQKQAGETRGRVHPHLGDSKPSRSQGYSNHSNVSTNVKLCWYCGEKKSHFICVTGVMVKITKLKC
ncbi:unnamed protein product [Mytilus edulis]|uniref:SGNH hydrolase-type esterase domain-containing protein n=1 Tax=Mytilus edulis TaxID=6550 RepID=A0A8S3THA0_MYTED|nr:unnamed protein product [Mytilus edulis]